MWSLEGSAPGALAAIYTDNDAGAQVPPKGGPNYLLINHPVWASCFLAAPDPLSMRLFRVSSSSDPTGAPSGNRPPPAKISGVAVLTSGSGKYCEPRLITHNL